MKEYKVKGMALHRGTNLPLVVLQEREGSKTLPIPVGSLEASSILIELEGATPPRPSAHDLMAHLFLRHRFKLTQVVISHLGEECSSALIYYRKGPKGYSIESRPADAIALAMRLSGPIFLTEEATLHVRSKLYADEVLEPNSPSYIYVEPNRQLLKMAY